MFGDRGTFSWSIGPLISWTIPNTGAAQSHRPGRGRHQGRRRPLRRRRAQRTARNGKRADRLCAPARPRKRAASRARAERQAASQARQLFQYGKTDYLTVLDAERTLAANESALAAAWAELSSDQIAVFLALGGGWEDGRTRPPALSPPSTPAGATIGRFRLIPPPAGASLQAFRLHGRPAALPLFPAPAARLHCAAERLLRHAQTGQAAGTRHRRGRQHAALQLKQTTIELTPAERAAVDQVRVRAYPRPTPRNCATPARRRRPPAMNRWPATPPPTSSPANATRSWSAAAASAARPAQVAGPGLRRQAGPPEHLRPARHPPRRRPGARLDRPEQHDLGQQWRRQEPRRHRRRRLPGPVRAPGPGAEDARALGTQPRKTPTPHGRGLYRRIHPRPAHPARLALNQARACLGVLSCPLREL